MNMKILFGLMLMASMAFAGTTYIAGCANLNSAGETYILTTDFSTSTTPCLDMNADNITLNCNGHTITYNNASGDVIYSATQDGMTLTNCIVVGTADRIVRWQDVTNSQIYGNTFNATNTISSSRPAAIWFYGTGSGSIYNLIFNNTIASARYGLDFSTNGESANEVLYNSFYGGTVWIHDLGTLNTYSTSTYGNSYYKSGGVPAYNVCNITSSTGLTWADSGTDLPFNSAEACITGYWLNNGNDYHPYTLNYTESYTANQNSPNRKNVQILVVDAAFRPLLSTSVKIVQVEPINNTNVTLGTYVTDEYGMTVQSLIPATYLYKFSVYDANGSTLIQAFPTVGIQCSSTDLLCKHTLIVDINSILPFYLRNNLVGSCSYDNGTLTITCSANDTTNTLTNLSLMAYTAGNTTQVCYDSEAASAATLTCELPADCGNFNYLFIGSDSLHSYLLSGSTISQNACADTTMFGRNGWMALLLLFGTVAMIGYYSIPVAMALGTLSLVFGALVQLVPWTIATPVIIFMAVALIISYRAKV